MKRNKKKTHKPHCANHNKNMIAGVIALLSIFALTTYAQWTGSGNESLLTGAVILKNACTSTPDLYVLVGSNDNFVYALDAASGCAAWKFDAGGDIKAKVTVASDAVFVGTTASELYAINFDDGSETWQVDTGKIQGSVVADSSYVYAGDNVGTFGAYDISSGTEGWTYTANNIKSDVILTNGIAYFVNEYLKVGSLVALDTTEQTAKWIFTATDKTQIWAAPAITNDAVYVASGSTLYKLNKDYGVAIWSFKAGKSIRTTPIVDSTGIIYFGSSDGYFYAVSKDGKVVWKYQVNAEMSGSAVVDDTNIYFGSQNSKVYALNKATGALVWEYKTGGKIFGGVTLYEDMLYVPSADYNVYALNSANGAQIWTYKTKGALYGGIVIVEAEFSTGLAERSVA